jgi:hypothetical protein
MNVMSKTIYLHIGANKTGSSALQNYFNNNRKALLDKGILYPSAGIRGDAHYELSDLLGFTQMTQAAVDFAAKPLVALSASLRSEILSHPANTVVISSEYFVLPKAVETVRRFFEGFDVKVVVYLRRHDKWWPSAYNQAVRTVTSPPWKRGFESFIKFHERQGPCPSKAAYRLLLDRWAAVFGKENVIVRPYEAQQNQPNIVSDFLAAIGCAEVSAQLPPMARRVNGSVDGTMLAYIDMLQRASIDQALRGRLIKYVLESYPSNGAPLSIDPAVLLALVQKNEQDYSYIAREYLGRQDGVLFYEPLPNPSKPWHKTKQPSPAEITELMVSFFSQRQKVAGFGYGLFDVPA